MSLFRPTVEALDSRTLLSISPTGLVGPTFVPVAAESAPPFDGGVEAAKVKFTDVLISSKMSETSPKVSFQDFHFVKTVDKSSPKVAMQDFHFTATVSKASPKLF